MVDGDYAPPLEIQAFVSWWLAEACNRVGERLLEHEAVYEPCLRELRNLMTRADDPSQSVLALSVDALAILVVDAACDFKSMPPAQWAAAPTLWQVPDNVVRLHTRCNAMRALLRSTAGGSYGIAAGLRAAAALTFPRLDASSSAPAELERISRNLGVIVAEISQSAEEVRVIASNSGGVPPYPAPHLGSHPVNHTGSHPTRPSAGTRLARSDGTCRGIARGCSSLN